MKSNTTTRGWAAAAAVLALSAGLTACTPNSATTPESVAEAFAAAYIDGDNEKAVALVCDGILDETKELGESWAVSSAAPPAYWDFSDLEYSARETSSDGEVHGALGDVQFDVSTAKQGDGYCVENLTLGDAGGYYKG